MTVVDFFNKAIESHGLDGVAANIGLHTNTVQRWHERGEVPPQYLADLARLNGEEVIPEGVKEKDQYFTKPQTAALCLRYLRRVCASLRIALDKYHFIEPSMGHGCFYDLLPAGRRTGIDIDPKQPETVKADYLRWMPNKTGNYAVVGNPPFGLRGHLALQFINHSAAFADVVAFVLPQLFESDGKGVPAKRVRGYTLAESIKLAPDSFLYPDGRPIQIHTVFQVWTKINTARIRRQLPKTCRQFISVVSLSDGGTPASTRNKDLLYACDVYLPSTCFQTMKAYRHFEDLPHRRGYGVVIHKNKRDIKRLLLSHNWQNTAFPSTNSAFNLRKSLIEQVVTDGGYADAN